MKKLFKLTQNGKTVVGSKHESKEAVKALRDQGNKEAGWVKADTSKGEPDNCNTMPFKVSKAVDHKDFK
jgi:hypothetical protein